MLYKKLIALWYTDPVILNEMSEDVAAFAGELMLTAVPQPTELVVMPENDPHYGPAVEALLKPVPDPEE